jgi:hypothetical protein
MNEGMQDEFFKHGLIVNNESNLLNGCSMANTCRTIDTTPSTHPKNLDMYFFERVGELRINILRRRRKGGNEPQGVTDQDLQPAVFTNKGTKLLLEIT